MTTMTPARPLVTGGVDTHRDEHVAAALDSVGGLLGTASFPTTMAGYTGLLAWLLSFGELTLVGVEGTGSYGAALARHLTSHGVKVLEVSRPNRQVRRRYGKNDVVGTATPTTKTTSPGWSRTPRKPRRSGRSPAPAPTSPQLRPT